MIDLKAKVKQDDLTICSMASAFHRLLSWHPAGPDKSPPVMSPLPETPEPEYVDGEALTLMRKAKQIMKSEYL